MKKLILILSIPLLFSCNKDEEITVEVPGGNDGTAGFTVLAYRPAPGQFINDPASGFTNVNSEEEAVAYAQSRIDSGNYVSLGAFGGYIVVKAPKHIINSGGYDFSIAGNAIETSNEPGIVWVMNDANGNGIPDDEWFELKGSGCGQEGYERNYTVTYYRPDARGNVAWTDSNGESGNINWLGEYHSQDSYYPSWIKEDSYSLSGSRLPDRKTQDPVTGQWAFPAFEWGYADNIGSDSRLQEINGKKLRVGYFKISNAVDANGDQVRLEGVDFIKVQTAVNASAGVIGENSTEVCGFFYGTGPGY